MNFVGVDIMRIAYKYARLSGQFLPAAQFHHEKGEMNRKDFGTLISMLRDDLGWTQSQLAEYAGIEESVVSNIERGAKRHFDPDLLFALANALQLSSSERYEFLVAASGFENNQLVRQPSLQTPTDTFDDDEALLSRLVELLARVRPPAFIVDGFGDIVAANYTAFSLMHASPDMVGAMEALPGGFNLLRMHFDPQMNFLVPDQAEWERYALTSLRTYREITIDTAHIHISVI